MGAGRGRGVAGRVGVGGRLVVVAVAVVDEEARRGCGGARGRGATGYAGMVAAGGGCGNSPCCCWRIVGVGVGAAVGVVGRSGDCRNGVVRWARGGGRVGRECKVGVRCCCCLWRREVVVESRGSR